MVLPDKAELRETGTGSLLSQPDPPGPTGTGQEMKRLASRSSLWGKHHLGSAQRGSMVASWQKRWHLDVQECTLMRKVCAQMKVGPLILGCQQTEPRKEDLAMS